MTPTSLRKRLRAAVAATARNLSWHCPACDEDGDGPTRVCPACGASRLRWRYRWASERLATAERHLGEAYARLRQYTSIMLRGGTDPAALVALLDAIPAPLSLREADGVFEVVGPDGTVLARCTSRAVALVLTEAPTRALSTLSYLLADASASATANAGRRTERAELRAEIERLDDVLAGRSRAPGGDREPVFGVLYAPIPRDVLDAVNAYRPQAYPRVRVGKVTPRSQSPLVSWLGVRVAGEVGIEAAERAWAAFAAFCEARRVHIPAPALLRLGAA